MANTTLTGTIVSVLLLGIPSAFAQTALTLEDPSGPQIEVTCDNASPDIYIHMLESTSDFATPVRLLFQGTEVDADYRARLEVDADELEYWQYDENKAVFEPSFPIAFLDALAEADRVILDVFITEDRPVPGIFNITAEDRNFFSSCSEANSERVHTELKALGLGPYAPTKESIAAEKAERAAGGRIYYYANYMGLLPELLESDLLPSYEESKSAPASTTSEALKPVSGQITYFKSTKPEQMARLEEKVIYYGFESLDQWAQTGDVITVAMIHMQYDQQKPGFVQEILAHTEEEKAQMNQGKLDYVQFMQGFHPTELDWFYENVDEYFRLTE